MKSHDVRVWGIRKRPYKAPSYGVRWKVGDTPPFSETFRTKALADNFRAKLLRAVQKGEAFDTETGLPDSMATAKPSLTWYEFARGYVAMKWPHAAPNSRDSTNETMTLVTTQLLADRPGRPADDVLRRALRGWAFVVHAPDDEPPTDLANALRWVAKASLPLATLKNPADIRRVLDSLKLTLAGAPAAAETVRRKRAVLFNALAYAVGLGELPENPVTLVKWKPPKVTKEVDRRIVVNPRQAGELLAAVSYVGGYRRARGRRLVALFACMYFGGLRPAEAVALRRQDCTLPGTGWGSLILEKSRPTVGKRWTGTGDVHDNRGLKNRAANETRIVPIPPRLVRMLLTHIKAFGTAMDGRLFANERGGVVASTTYWRVWDEARHLALTPEQAASPLAARPAARGALLVAQRRGGPGRGGGAGGQQCRGAAEPVGEVPRRPSGHRQQSDRRTPRRGRRPGGQPTGRDLIRHTCDTPTHGTMAPGLQSGDLGVSWAPPADSCPRPVHT